MGGHEGYEEEGSDEGHEGHEEEGSDEGHEGHEEKGSDEGHEGHEEEGSDESHEGHEEEGSHESHEGDEEEGDESQQDRQGKARQIPRLQGEEGEDCGWLDQEQFDQEQGGQSGQQGTLCHSEEGVCDQCFGAVV